jgi:hypothetical protein
MHLLSGSAADRLEELQGVGQARSGPGAMPGGAAGNDNSVLQKCRVGAVNGQWWDGRGFPSPRLATRIQAWRGAGRDGPAAHDIRVGS